MKDFKDELKQLEKMKEKVEAIPDQVSDDTNIKHPKGQAISAINGLMNQIAIVAKLAS